MSILIKGLDVTALNDDSSVCYKDIRLFADGSATTSSGEHPYIKTFEWVEVPTPHGDLIDRDKLLSDIDHYHVSDGKFQHWTQVQNAVIESEE